VCGKTRENKPVANVSKGNTLSERRKKKKSEVKRYAVSAAR
jgi:hypothetical protein